MAQLPGWEVGGQRTGTRSSIVPSAGFPELTVGLLDLYFVQYRPGVISHEQPGTGEDAA